MPRILTLAAAACLTLRLAAAQQPPTFTSDVRLVRMLVTVKDIYGQLIGNLRRDDFALYDNGIKQEIKVFDRESSQPLSVALMVDTSASTAKDLKEEIEAVRKFLRGMLASGNPDDRVSIYSFNWVVTQHTPYTRSMSTLESGLKKLKAEAGTSMYDAIYLATHELERRDGRHVMVMVTDGGDTISKTTFQEALRALHMADAVFYAILVMPITNDAGRNIGGENALTTMSMQTGGRVFFPSSGGAVGEALTDILGDLRTQYLIGFYPAGVPLTKERFHRVKIVLGSPDLRAITRSGYYGEYDKSSARPESPVRAAARESRP